MDSIEKARLLINRLPEDKKQGAAHSSNVTTIRGVAVSDSVDGVVKVDLGGVTVSEDDQQEVEVDTLVDVREGDVVQIRVAGSDGSAKSVMADGVVGGGDRTKADIEAARTIAAEAQAAAEATEQHFWHRSVDESGDGAGTGAFVTDEEQETFLDAMAHDVQPTETRPLHNLLMNASGILLRAAKRIRASFTPSGVAFYDGQGNEASNVVAAFGADGAQIGNDSGTRLKMDYHSMELIDKEGNTFFHVSDLRSNHTAEDEFGEGLYYVVTENWTGDGQSRSYSLAYTSTTTNYKVYVDGVEVESVRKEFEYFSLTSAPSDGAEIEVVYPTSDIRFKAYTLGVRSSVGAVGLMSVAEGRGNTASGRYSHAEGGYNKAAGEFSHAEGESTEATGDHSHAEGSFNYAIGANSHAEGVSARATGDYSHAEGINTEAIGRFSHAEGNHTEAASAAQHVQGRRNISDDANKYADIVGNGSGDVKSNAYTLDWDGNGQFAGGVYVGAKSVNGAYQESSLGIDEYGAANLTSLKTSGEVDVGGTLKIGGSPLKFTSWTVSAKINNAYGNGIFRSASLTKDISAYGFTKPPKVWLHSTGLQCWVQTTNVTATQVTYFLVRGSSLATASDVNVNLLCIGDYS